MDYTGEIRSEKGKFFAQVMAFLVIINTFFSVLLVMTMYQMGSRMNVLTQLFNTTRGSETMFYSDALDGSVSNADILEWGFVQRYIEERVFFLPDSKEKLTSLKISFLSKEMFKRWGVYGSLANMSYAGSHFTPTYKNSDARLKYIEDRSPIHAENIRFVSRVGHFWTVDFDECTQEKESGSVCVKKRVNIAVDFKNFRKDFVPVGYRYFNPLGMVAVEWQETVL